MLATSPESLRRWPANGVIFVLSIGSRAMTKPKRTVSLSRGESKVLEVLLVAEIARRIFAENADDKSPDLQKLARLRKKLKWPEKQSKSSSSDESAVDSEAAQRKEPTNLN